MCLNLVTHKFNQPEGELEAWKAFEKKETGLYGVYRNRNGTSVNYSTPYPVEKWLCSTVSEIDSIYESYPSGFHCFYSKSDAKNMMGSDLDFFKVKIRGIVAIGEEGRDFPVPAIVAREMFIPPPKPPNKRKGKVA
jgi:hypothetical protein